MRAERQARNNLDRVIVPTYGTGMTWTGPRRALSATQRVSALLVVLLWGATPVLSVVHASAAEHRYCAEHGGLEDAPAVTGGQAVASGNDVASSRPAQAPAHEGCAFARYCQFARPPEPAAPDPLRVLEVPAVVHGLPCAPPAAISLLSLAPKTSPPA
jgi:hypothetical protein